MEEEVKDSIEVEDKNNESSNKNKKSKKGIIFLVVCLVLVLAIVLLVILLMQPKDKEKKTSNKNRDVFSEYRMSGNSLENFDLYFLQLENEAKNKVYSPLSIKYTLAMLAAGADGDTKAQIEAVIGDYKSKKYTNSEHMSFANAIFIRDSFKKSIKKGYTDTLSSKYNAEVIYDAFNDASLMNKWVSDKTFKLIDNLLDDDTVKQEDFILMNALAIDMNWVNLIQCAGMGSKLPCMRYGVSYEHENYSDYVSEIGDGYMEKMKFNDQENTKALHFATSANRYDIIKELGADNIRKTVGDAYQKWLDEGNCGGASDNPDVNTFLEKYMKELGSNYKQLKASTDYYFYTDDSVKVFAKDLQKYDNTTLQYVAIMPKEDSLVDYVKNTDSKKINKIISSLKEIKLESFKDGVVTQVKGMVPVFNYDYKLDFINDLKKLGIEDIFDINKANLTKMLEDGTKEYISDASHKATIEFSNEGIKAAAVTQLGGAGATGCYFEYKYDVPVEIINLEFDKPFMYLVRDKDTGEVWFVGTLYEGTK